MMSKKVKATIMIVKIVFVILSCYITVNADVPGELYTYDNPPGYGDIETVDTNAVEESQEMDIFNAEVVSELSDNIVLPEKIDMSADKYFPPINSQMGNSCVAWATTYYQFTYEVARMNNWDAKNDYSKVFSPKFVWNHINGGIDQGSIRNDCYRILENYGAVTWEDFPQTNLNMDWYQGETYEETVDVLRNSLTNRISSWTSEYIYEASEIVEGMPNITSYNDSDLDRMKFLLSSGHPLTFSTFIDLFYTETMDNGELICLYLRNNIGYAAGHSMTIVGYDDTISFDLNDDNVIQDYEKGAFKVANSWGTGYGNDGYIWILYDAFNTYSNVDSLNFNDRISAVRNNYYNTITVAKYEPKITAEVTLEFKKRTHILLKTACSYEGEQTGYNLFYYSSYGGHLNGSGGTTYEPFVFVVDYTESIEEIMELNNSSTFNYEDYYYWLNITDTYVYNDNVITIDKVKWVKDDGTVIRTLSDQGTIDGTSKELSTFVTITNLNFNETNFELYKNEEIALLINILPSNASNKELVWTSSDTSVATVDSSGVVKYVGMGESVITAATTDGSNIVASCTVTTYDDFADHFDRATVITTESTTDGEIEYSYDEDYFKFIAPYTGKFVFYSEGYTDIVLYTYDDNNDVIEYNDDYSQAGYYNAGVSCDMQEGEIYYIRINAYDVDVGEYSLIAVQAYEKNDLTCYVMQYGRHIMIEGHFSAIFNTVTIPIGNKEYTITIPDDLSDIDTTIDGIRFLMDFKEARGGYYIYWDVDIFIPTTQEGVSEDIIYTFSQEDLSVTLNLSEAAI